MKVLFHSLYEVVVHRQWRHFKLTTLQQSPYTAINAHLSFPVDTSVTTESVDVALELPLHSKELIVEGNTAAGRRQTHLIPCNVLHFLDDFCPLISSIQVGYVAGVEDHADVLHETLVFDLTVGEQEHCLTTVTTGLEQQLHRPPTQLYRPHTQLHRPHTHSYIDHPHTPANQSIQLLLLSIFQLVHYQCPTRSRLTINYYWHVLLSSESMLERQSNNWIYQFTFYVSK